MLAAALWLLLVCCAAQGATSSRVTVDFTITMPNGSYPTLGEYWEGSITYAAKPDPRPQAGGFPTGHLILAVNGTRTVWTSGGGAVHLFHSTARIIGPAHSDNCYIVNNNSIPLAPGVNRASCAPDQKLGLAGPDVVGLATIYAYEYAIRLQQQQCTQLPMLTWWRVCVCRLCCSYLNVGNYTAPDGFQQFPVVDIAYDNHFYPTAEVVDSLDFFGWTFLLDQHQPGCVPNVKEPHVPKLNNAVNIYSWNGNPAAGGDITDLAGNWDLPEDGFEQTPFGFRGTITISNTRNG
jgi:hypothetical protein